MTKAKMMYINRKEYRARGENELGLAATARRSKTIIFDTEQINVFWKLIRGGNFLPSVDYRLPFPDIWLQFSSKTILIDPGYKFVEAGEVALLITQSPIIDSANILNRIVIVHPDEDDEILVWYSEGSDEVFVNFDNQTALPNGEQYRLLAAACIQYINCENVYLEKQGEVPESVNRKREAKGKSRLEPYYVCRIKGVQYNSDGTETGSKHGIRYDVRGHFRRLTTGKTIWVRPHQRGLANELYIPKVYKVDKGSKPGFAA